MLDRLRAAARFEFRDEILDLVGLRRVEHEDGVLGRHDDHVADADDRRELVGRAHEDIIAAHDKAVAMDAVPIPIVIGKLHDRRPCAHIGPADVGGNHHRSPGMLHHRIVDGDLGRGLHGLRIQNAKLQIKPGGGDRLCGCRRNLGMKSLQLLPHDIGAEEEIPGIPEIALGHVDPGFRLGRLFDEGRHPARRCAVAEVLAGVDIAIACGRMVGPDAKGDDVPIGGRDRSLRAELDEGLGLAHDMIGGENAHNGLWPALQRQLRCNPHRSCGVPSHGLKDDLRLHADLGELFGDKEPILDIGQDDGPLEIGGGERKDGPLKGGQRVQQGDELLGKALTRFRPHPGARAAAHDDGENLLH